MAPDTSTRRRSPGAVIKGKSRAAACWYRLYGLRVLSDVRLPVAPIRVEREAAADWTFQLADPGHPAPPLGGPIAAELRCPEHHNTIAARYQAADGFWIVNPWIATFHVTPASRRVVVYPDVVVDEERLAHTLAGEIAILALQILGIPTLHASAVVVNGRAVAFVGTPGHGKSTIAAGLLRRGAALLADDNLPLHVIDGRVSGGPSLPMMKIWSETAECALGIQGELPSVTASLDKKLLDLTDLNDQYRFVDVPTRLSVIYALNRYDPVASGRVDVHLKTLSQRDALTTLLSHTAYAELFLPAEVARFLPLYVRLVAQTPMRLLTYPQGFEHQQVVYDRIVEDLESA